MDRPSPAVAAWLRQAPVADDLPGSCGQSVPAMRTRWDGFLVDQHHLVRDLGPLHAVEHLATPGGTPVRLYLPTPEARSGSVHVHLHGGAWWMGSTATVDAMSRELAIGLGMAVASVDYRLAPESPFPAALDDVHDALTWLDQTFDRISIGGESAGANLAAAVSLMVRDRGGPALVAQWLDAPAVDLRFPMDESHRLYGEGYGVETSTMSTVVGWYAGDDRDHPYVSPATADLAGLPPTIVTTAACDPLRDQGEAFAAALAAAGVAVEHRRAAGHVHGSTWFTALDESTARWHDEVVSLLVAHHARTDLELIS